MFITLWLASSRHSIIECDRYYSWLWGDRFKSQRSVQACGGQNSHWFSGQTNLYKMVKVECASEFKEDQMVSWDPGYAWERRGSWEVRLEWDLEDGEKASRGRSLERASSRVGCCGRRPWWLECRDQGTGFASVVLPRERLGLVHSDHSPPFWLSPDFVQMARGEPGWD